MFFRVKDLKFSTGGLHVAWINKKDAELYDIHASDRIQVWSGRKFIVCVIDLSLNNNFPSHVVGLSCRAIQKLKVKNNSKVNLKILEKPKSISYIRKKLSGIELSESEISEIVKDIINNKLADIELAYFIAGYFTEGSTIQESIALTKAIAHFGSKITFTNKKKILDKHCVGGVPGNRTTMIVIPIIASLGYIIPKTSSRSITSPAGTADTVEALANVILDVPTIKKVLRQANGCMVWGGGVDIASADDRLIKVRHSMSLDPEGMLISSILAKKFSVGATDVLIDIPYGSNTKYESKKDAENIKKKMQLIGRGLGMNTHAILTLGDQPIGNGIGPVLEWLDVLAVLANQDFPPDLYRKSLLMAGKLISMVEHKTQREGVARAKQTLQSGKALQQMYKIMHAQGLNFSCHPTNFLEKARAYLHRQLGKHSWQLLATRSAKIKSINNRTISHIARLSGCPNDKGAGIYLHKKVGDSIQKGETLYTIYTNNKDRLRYARHATVEDQGIILS